MKKLFLSTLAQITLAFSCLAQVSTQPVGFNTVTALGNSDTRLSPPLHRTPVFSGTVQSVTGNVIVVQEATAWSVNQFVYSAGVQTDTYYVSFTSGSKPGMFYTVTANDATSVTLDLNGDASDGVVKGDSLMIIPYWTLATLFPGQAGITGTTNIFGTGAVTQILLTDGTAVGKNLAATHTYYYFTGSSNGGPGWRRVGGGFSNIKNDDVILPDMPLIVRQNNVPTSQITVTGNVPMAERRHLIGTLAANTVQDNIIAVDLPVPLTLTQSNLYESGAFAGTANIFGTGGDQLLVFDDSVASYNKSASSTYYYFTGSTNGGPGWRKVGGGFSTIQNATVALQPGSGYIIRKQATASPATMVWNIPLTY